MITQIIEQGRILKGVIIIINYHRDHLLSTYYMLGLVLVLFHVISQQQP